MRRFIWLAVGPLLVLAVGGWLMWILPEDGKPTKRMSKSNLVLPSGLRADLQEVLSDQSERGLIYRYRFVAPEFVADAEGSDNMADLEYLCTHFALPKLADITPIPAQVVISLADKPSEFGRFNPNVAQVFEAYRIENEACIWEMF